MKPLNKIFILVIFLLHWNCQHDEITVDPNNFDCLKYPVLGFYNFPIRSGILDSLQIPDHVLDTISTEALIKTCLNFPCFLNILFTSSCNDIQGTFEFYIEHFNGFNTLYKRNDVSYKLLERYMCCGLEDKYTSTLVTGETYIYYFLEIMLAQNKIIEKLNEKNKKILFKKVLETYETNLTNLNGFSVFSSLILGRIMVIDEFQPFISEYNKNVYLQGFLSSGFHGFDNSVFSTIEQCAKFYK